jgi:hypothetical protein
MYVLCYVKIKLYKKIKGNNNFKIIESISTVEGLWWWHCSNGG